MNKLLLFPLTVMIFVFMIGLSSSLIDVEEQAVTLDFLSGSVDVDPSDEIVLDYDLSVIRDHVYYKSPPFPLPFWFLTFSDEIFIPASSLSYNGVHPDYDFRIKDCLSYAGFHYAIAKNRLVGGHAGYGIIFGDDRYEGFIFNDTQILTFASYSEWRAFVEDVKAHQEETVVLPTIFNFTFDITDGIAVIISLVVAVFFLGVGVMGSGFTSYSQNLALQGFFYIGLWSVLSLASYGLFVEIGVIGNVAYWLMTIMYVIGFVREVGSNVGDIR